MEIAFSLFFFYVSFLIFSTILLLIYGRKGRKEPVERKTSYTLEELKRIAFKLRRRFYIIGMTNTAISSILMFLEFHNSLGNILLVIGGVIIISSSVLLPIITSSIVKNLDELWLA